MLTDIIAAASFSALAREDPNDPGNHHQGHPDHKGPAGPNTGLGTAQEEDGTALERIHIGLLGRGRIGRVQTPEAETAAFGERDAFSAARSVPARKNNRLPARASKTVNNLDIPKTGSGFVLAYPAPFAEKSGRGAVLGVSFFSTGGWALTQVID